MVRAAAGPANGAPPKQPCFVGTRKPSGRSTTPSEVQQHKHQIAKIDFPVAIEI